jgi:hypothetical protein
MTLTLLGVTLILVAAFWVYIPLGLLLVGLLCLGAAKAEPRKALHAVRPPKAGGNDRV